MTKQEVLNKLAEHPEDDYPLWDFITDLLNELAELERLQSYALVDAERGYDYLHQPYWPHLHELELKFGV